MEVSVGERTDEKIQKHRIMVGMVDMVGDLIWSTIPGRRKMSAWSADNIYIYFYPFTYLILNLLYKVVDIIQSYSKLSDVNK